MDLGQRLLDFRKSINLSQEEVAEKLNVTRQTISKWETGQSTPDFDKIVPICELYGITPDELFAGSKNEDNRNISITPEEISKKKAGGIALSVFIYILALSWITFSVAGIGMNPVIATSIFLLLCGIATLLIIYTCMVYKKEKTKKEKRRNKLKSQIESVLGCITLVIYLYVSFTTGAWYITWLIWIILGLVCEVLSLIFMLRGDKNEE